ncbi:MAG: type II secretion system F family protein [Phycisphaerales bacterium]
MAVYSYTTADRSRASIDAPDRQTALRELIRRGVTPTSLADATDTDATTPFAATKSHGSVMSRSEVAMFIRELATATMAGLPLTQALRTLGKQGRTKSQREMIDALISEVEAGRTLSDAMTSWGRPFSDLVVNLTRAGEASGKLDEVLAQAAELLDKDLKLRRSITSAVMYPAILLVLIVGAIVVVVTFIVPTLLKPLAGHKFNMPMPTQVVLAASHFFVNYWYIALPATIFAFFSAAMYYKDPEGRTRVDTAMLKVPVLGRLVKDAAVARFTRTLSTLAMAGIPIIQSLKVTKGTLGNRAMEGVIDTVCEQVAAGRTIAEPMEKSGYFPPMLVQIVNIGERSGKLDELLGQAARAFEERTEMSVKLFNAVFPPLLIVCMASVVGFIVLAVLMALLEFQNAVMSG